MKENNDLDKSFDDEQYLLTYNKLVSFGYVTDKNDKKQYCHLMMREENLEENLVFRRCNVNSDVSLLKESLFQLKRPSEKKENFKSENKEDGLVEYNSLFNLYHIVSKKYLTIEKNSSKNYILKLIAEESQVTPFSIKKIVDSKSNSTAVIMSQIVYLSGYIKEKSQYYFIDIKLQYKEKNNKSDELVTRVSTKESGANSNFLDDTLGINEHTENIKILRTTHSSLGRFFIR